MTFEDDLLAANGSAEVTFRRPARLALLDYSRYPKRENTLRSTSHSSRLTHRVSVEMVYSRISSARLFNEDL